MRLFQLENLTIRISNIEHQEADKALEVHVWMWLDRRDPNKWKAFNIFLLLKQILYCKQVLHVLIKMIIKWYRHVCQEIKYWPLFLCSSVIKACLLGIDRCFVLASHFWYHGIYHDELGNLNLEWNIFENSRCWLFIDILFYYIQNKSNKHNIFA